MRKRLCFTVLSMLMLLSACFITASAETDATPGETEYRFDEDGFSVSIPDSMETLTRHSTAEEAAALGLGGASVADLFGDTLLLDAVQADGRLIEITLVMPYLDNPNEEVANVQDFNRLSEEEIKDQLGSAFRREDRDALLADEGLPEDIELNIFDADIEVYQHTQARFARMPIDAAQGDVTVYGYMYMTVYGSEQYCVYLKRYDAPLDAEDYALLQHIVDSLRFDAAPNTEPIPSAAASIAKATLGGALKGAIIGVVGAAVVGTIFVKRKKREGVQGRKVTPYNGKKNGDGSEPQGPAQQ